MVPQARDPRVTPAHRVLVKGLHAEEKMSIVTDSATLVKEIIEVLLQYQFHVKVLQHAGGREGEVERERGEGGGGREGGREGGRKGGREKGREGGRGREREWLDGVVLGGGGVVGNVT